MRIMKNTAWIVVGTSLSVAAVTAFRQTRESTERASQPSSPPPILSNPKSEVCLFQRTNSVLLNTNWDWRQLESTNYVEYVANLRRVNCPEQTIRDILVADLRSISYTPADADQIADQLLGRSKAAVPSEP